jgi:hypothetical protein
MVVTIPIPDDLDDVLGSRARSGRPRGRGRPGLSQGKLSHGQFAKFLGIGRDQADEVLGRHGIVDEFTADEIAAQVRVSQEGGFECE